MMTNATITAHAEGQPPLRLFWATFTILLGTFMGVLDASITNVALPSIAADLHSQPAHAVWTVTGYQLAMMVAVLPLAALGERIGYARVFVTGMVLFTLASVLCALAPSMPLLIAARVLQGAGGACMSTIVPALLRVMYPPKQVGTAVSYLALTVALSAALGPTVAAGILSVASWRWLFGVNLPIGMLGTLLAMRELPRQLGADRPFDVAGSILNAVALTLLILGVGGLGERGARGVSVAEIVGACVAGVALIRHQRGKPAPLVPLDLLEIPMLRLSAGTSVCSYTAQTMAMLAMPFLLVSQMGRSPSVTGLLMTPWPLVIVVVAPLSGRLSDRYRADVVGAVGLAVFAVGLAVLAMLPSHASNGDIVWRVALCGIGFGLFQTPNNRLLITCAPKERSGAAGGLMTMARMIGMTLGAAVATILLDLEGTAGALTALLVAAVAAGGGFVVSLWRLRREKER
jgi:DHA2 family multidrug resistance protein-like MFS transporter